MALTGPPAGPPYKVGFQVVDAATGLAIGQAVLAALLRRTQTGEGAHLRISLFEVSTYLQTPYFVLASRSGEELERPGNTAGLLGAPTDLFEVLDGYLQLVAYFPDQWIKLCNLIDMPELLQDERFVTNAARVAHKEELFDVLAPVFATRTRDEWSKLLTDAGVISAPVRTHQEILTDPYLRSLANFVPVDNGVMEPHVLPATPYRSNTWDPVAGTRPPALGEDSDAILSELGYSADQIAALHEAHVIHSEVYPAYTSSQG
jgi:crotonobetainyl-CoA:carnitine CoA-transferase CaiB-like acyl-CoA transferase